jgi:hypothetical protein
MLSGDVAETTRMAGVSYIDGQPILATNIRARTASSTSSVA